MKEIWKDIKGYEGLYQVSNFGRIKSLKRIVNCTYNSSRIVRERIKRYTKDKDGYLQVNLSKEGKNKTHKAHRLVAISFLENSNNLPEINHKDENKQNNKINNLEWCTKKYNNNYGNKLKSIKQPVLQYDLNNNFIKRYDCIADFEREIEKNCHWHISECCKGKRKSAYGYIWMFDDK